MADVLTKSQAEIDAAIFELEDHQQTFIQNYGNAIAVVRRALFHEVTVAAATGLALGGLVGALVGVTRRKAIP